MPADNTALLAKRERQRLAAEIKRRKNGIPQVKGTQICCVRCGELFERKNRLNKACLPCRPIVQREAAKEYQTKLRAEGISWNQRNPEYAADYSAKYQRENPERCAAWQARYKDRNPEKVLEYRQTRGRVVQKEYYEKNKEYLSAQTKKWREANIETVLVKNRAKNKKRYAENKEKEIARIVRYRNSEQGKAVLSASRRRWDRRKRKEDPIHAMKIRMRCRVREAVRNLGYTKRSKTNEILGCGWDEFKAHIERQFTKGMGWENLDKWHLDHIIPLDGADSLDDVYRLNHFTNIRPLWAEDNIRKSSKKIYLI